MPEFLLEFYLPHDGAGATADDGESARVAAEELTRRGTSVRFRRLTSSRPRRRASPSRGRVGRSGAERRDVAGLPCGQIGALQGDGHGPVGAYVVGVSGSARARRRKGEREHSDGGMLRDFSRRGGRFGVAGERPLSRFVSRSSNDSPAGPSDARLAYATTNTGMRS
jgi:hypothetical protein